MDMETLIEELGDVNAPVSSDRMNCLHLALGCGAAIAGAGIGKSKTHVCIRVGSWKFHLLIDADGRFPRYESILPKDLSDGARMRIVADDAVFLMHALPRLPGRDLPDQPVTIDLNGHVAIRAKDDGECRTTQLHLARSAYSGQSLRFVCSRQHLVRAVQLGFPEVQIAGPRGLILCRDIHRTYVWIALNPETALKPSRDAVRISTSDSEPDQNHSQPERNETTMNEQVHANGNGASASETQANGEETAPTGFDALIVETEAVRDSLRDAYARAARLVSGVRRQKKKSKLVRETLASLRQLQSIES